MCSRLLAKNAVLNPSVAYPKESLDIAKELTTSHMSGAVSYASRLYLVILLIETVNFYFNDFTKSLAFQATGFYPIANQLVQKLLNLFEELNSS